MRARLHHLIVDCPDPVGLAGFYSAMLARPVTYADDGRLATPLERLAATTLNRIAGSVLAVVGAFWLADGGHLGPAPTIVLVVCIAVLVTLTWYPGHRSIRSA